MLWWWATRKKRLANKALKQKFPAAWRVLLQENVDFYRALSKVKKRRFEKRVAIFLAQSHITAVKTELDDLSKLLIAASAIIPTWGYKDWAYPDMGEIYLTDGAVEVTHLEGGHTNITAGQVKPQGNQHMVVLSKQALIQGFKNGADRKNVGIHEFVHLLDEEDGEVDGIPAQFLPPELQPAWERLVRAKIKQIKAGGSDVNTYGATSPAEYFAVITEYFFERPAKLLKSQPGMYRLLTKVFRQNPARLFKLSSAKNNQRNKAEATSNSEVGRNDNCPCGSGKKYKKCCLPKVEAAA
jgi:Mlc titration factor MtfA (ptsG expression regulator)